jgi:tetratricopeptide (TPR) repeat protein
LLLALCPEFTAQTVPTPDPQALFQSAEADLRSGHLDLAERAFQHVLKLDPQNAGAYANLGVIHMRRKQWPLALQALRHAEKLAPNVAGIRLNIGLVYFRQSDFLRAIPPLESVLQESQDAYQPRYLLGLCYFFQDRWTDTITALLPLWSRASDQLNYLYVLEHAADKANNPALASKSAARMIEIGQGSPEFHLLTGKGLLNSGECADAIKELQSAATADGHLPFVHFNLGLAYTCQQDFDHARMEFHQDIALAPDLPFSYEQLGSLEATAGNDAEAGRNYRSALRLDPDSIASHMGLAKVEERQHRYVSALAQLDIVLRLQSENAAARYLRGQVLLHMGRVRQGREELALAAKMLNQQRASRHQELEGESVPSPELAREPQ